MQKRLASNRPADAVHGGTSEASWLTGLLFDTDGNRFTPSHTTKRGRHYRYYVCLGATQGRKADGRSATRLPAREIEGVVLKELEAVTASSHRLLDLISDIPSDPEEMNTIVQAAAVFSERLGRHEAMTKAVSKVVLASDGVTIFVCRRNLREAIGLEREGCAEGQTELTVAIDLTRTRGVLRFKVTGAKDDSIQESPALINAVVKSRGWLDRILRGDAASQRDLAAQEGYDERYVSRLLPLAFLSPEITEAVLEGTQPEHWSLDTLLGKVPLDWSAQRALLEVR